MPAPSPRELKDEFLLDPAATFLNHGSFGACPRPVFERYQEWQRELERGPFDFITRRLRDLLDESRAALAAHVGSAPEDVAFVQNATTGVNLAARSLELRPGDEVLATTLEYGACDLAWQSVCEHAGARYVRAEVPLPIASPEAVVEALFARRSERTRVVFVSHVGSETGLLLPVEPIVARARAEGLVTVVDGAHAPGHLPLDLESTGADFYAGNCHKWLCAPKGAAFLHVRPEHQERVGGAIVSWGYSEPATFLSRIERQGTRDPAAYLAVPDAIAFQRERAWDDVRARCVALAREARLELCAALGTEPIAPPEMVLQMASVQLPRPDPDLEQHLFDDHRVEVHVMPPACELLRVSIAGYNDRADVERLLATLG